MRGTNKAKETKRRASQRRATHKARRSALGLRAEMLMAAVEAKRARRRSAPKAPSNQASPRRDNPSLAAQKKDLKDYRGSPPLKCRRMSKHGGIQLIARQFAR